MANFGVINIAYIGLTHSYLESGRPFTLKYALAEVPYPGQTLFAG